MTQRISFSSVVLAVSVAVIIGAAASQRVAAEELEFLCEESRTTHPLPEKILPSESLWVTAYEAGSGPERVVVVVWDHPDEHLYNDLSSQIETYADDLAASGFTVEVFKFYGMAEDPEHPTAEDLRWQLREMWEQEESLVGAVLVGNVPHLLYETTSTADFPCDMLLCDMDGEISDVKWEPDVFDTWVDENQEIEIWTSRIMARPELVYPDGYFGTLTQVQLLATYFTRNHERRLNLFNSSGEVLLYSNETLGEWEGQIVGVLSALFGDDQVTSFCGEDVTGREDYLERLEDGYAHIEVVGHGVGGVPQYHLFSDPWEAVWHDDYAEIDPETLSYTFQCCYVFDFADDGACVGEVVVFNPDAPTLVGFGCTKNMAVNNTSILYSVLREGHCLGEGYKAQVNSWSWYTNPVDAAGGFVLLGDGTLKRWARWTGEGYYKVWSDPENWSSADPPTEIDNVLHINNDDVIQMDIGSPWYPTEILGFVGDGALGGGLQIWSQRALELAGDAVLGNGYDVTLDTGQEGTPTTLTVEGDIFHGNFAVSNNSVLETRGLIHHCKVDVVGPNALVEARGITGGPATGQDQDWTIDHGTVVADGASTSYPSTLWGNWDLTGGSATFGQMSANEEYGISMTLQDAAQVEIMHMPSDGPAFPDTAEHELVYGAGANQFGGGLEDSVYTDWLYFGDYTRIKALEGANEPNLNLDLRCELRIASDFEHEFVYHQEEGWDSRYVDITAQPIWADEPHPGQGYPEQAIELISPEFEDEFQGDPMVFLDVPCHGAFRDLIISAWEPDEEHPADDPPVPVAMRDYYDNAASGGEQPETAFFHNVTIGANRTVKFYTADGLIYYWGILEMEDGANVYVDDVLYDVCGPACRGVVDTIYGDWNGDCTITNAELADLQRAIAGGSGTYNPLMDYDCDGYLTSTVELPAFLDNMRTQPSCEPRGGDGGGGESWSESYEGYGDVPGLAAWLTEVLSEEQLKAFVADLAAAAAEFADSPVGQDLAELLSCLE